jgi:hypothetical protein
MRERRTTRRGGRRSSAPSLDTIYWRDIPAQLTARVGGEQEKILLHARFQHAIDRAADVAGLTSTDDYVNEWRVSPEPLDTPPDTEIDALLRQRCEEIEAAYPRERLETLVAAGGVAPPSQSPPPPPSAPPGAAPRQEDHT